MSTEHLQQFEESKTILEWSEFHYHLFSHLISNDCPRDLAQDVELAMFSTTWVPQDDVMKLCVEACVLSQDPDDLNTRLREIVELVKKAHPGYLWQS